jgi:hypothetical protein
MLTKACELRELTFDLTFLCTDYIFMLFKRYKNEYKDNLTFATMFNSSWKKINKYYKLLNKTPANIAVIVLYFKRK